MSKLNFKSAERIAREQFHVETLIPANRDARDFHSVSVRAIYDALDAAYQLGKLDANKPGRVPKINSKEKFDVDVVTGEAIP